MAVVETSLTFVALARHRVICDHRKMVSPEQFMLHIPYQVS